MSRKQLVGITRQNVQAHGGREVMVVGQEVWEEWTGRTVEETAWRKQAKRQWRDMKQASMRRELNKDLVRDKVYDKGSPSCSLNLLRLVTLTTLINPKP